MPKGSLILLLLISVFSIGSWIDINGVWVELPLLVNRLSEGWKLPTYVIALVQLSNIAPLIYFILFYKRKFQNLERFTIYFILSIGCICCALLAIFWKYSLDIFAYGKWYKFSGAFLILVWILSIVDTTSSVTFLPYFVDYPREFITALYIGEGFSGFLPGIAGLIQGAGGDPFCNNKTGVNGTNFTTEIEYPPPRFSISLFFVILCIILMICLISFAFIDNVKHFKIFKNKTISGSNSVLDFAPLIDQHELKYYTNDKNDSEKNPKSSIAQNILYILLVAYINFFTNGVLPSIQNYSLMPYSVNLYHLVVTMTQILNPLACLLTIRQWNVDNKIVIFLTTLGSFGTAYIIFLACKSPTAVMNDTSVGEILAAFSWFMVIILFSFEKALLAIELQKDGHFWLQMCGASTQIGSALGAILIFIFVAILDIFKSKEIIC